MKEIFKNTMGNILKEYHKRKVKPLINRVDNIVSQAGDSNTEIVDARTDSAGNKHKTLNDRINNEFKLGKEHLVSIEGSNITINDSMDSFLQNIEIKGNTIQNPDNLADIKSVGDKVGEQELYRIPIKCVKADGNLLNPKEFINKKIINHLGCEVDNTVDWYATPFIKLVGKNLNVLGISNTKVSNGTTLFVCYYTKTREFISSQGITASSETTSLVIPSDTEYLRMTINKLDINTCYLGENTKYEEYQEYKLNILSPVQLEKVGDVEDKIIEKDGVWGVEKNITHYTLNGSNCVIYKSEANAYTNIVRFWISDSANPNMNIKENQSVICDRFKSHGNSLNVDEEGVANTNGIDIHILKSKLASEDVIGFNKYLSENNTTLIYQANAPQFIPLPDNQQIKLKTFANQTNISFLTETEGTIKADVPKSLGASVNSNTQAIQDLNEDLEKVKRLEEATAIRVSTDNGIATCDNTIKGRVNDVKIIGNTLVNRFTFSNIGQDNESTKEIVASDYKSKLCLGMFSIPNISNKCLNVNIYNRDNDRYIKTIPIQANSTLVIDLDAENAYLYNLVGNVSDGWKNCDELKQYAIFIQGKHENLHEQISSYFEGMKSAGEFEDDFIITYSSNPIVTFEQGSLHSGNATLVNSPTRITSKQFLKGHNGYTDIRGIDTSKYQIIIFDFDENYRYLGDYDVRQWSKETKIKLLPNAKYYKFCVKINDNTNISVDEFKNYITGGDIDILNVIYKDVNGYWKKPILREWDSIEKHSDGKYYYHKRSFEEILKGNLNENWSIIDTGTSHKVFTCQIPKMKINNDNVGITILCDKISSKSNEHQWFGEHDSISVGLSTNYVRIRKNSLNGSLENFKRDLQENPITIVGILKEEEVYECVSLDVNTFDECTTLQIVSNITPQEFSFTVSNNIGNIVKDIQDDVSELKDWKSDIVNATTLIINTNKSLEVVDGTYDGYFKDVKLEGKTEINYISRLDTFRGGNSNVLYTNIYKLKDLEIGKTYTFIPYNLPNYIKRMYVGDSQVHNWIVNFTNDLVPTAFTITKNINLDDMKPHFYLNEGETATSEQIDEMTQKVKIVIVEGDCTQNPPDFFENVKSVGDDVDDIIVSSRAEDKNLCSIETDLIKAFSYGDYKTDGSAGSILIKCEPNTKYYINSEGGDRSVITTYIRKPQQDDKASKVSESGYIVTGKNDKYLLYYLSSDINVHPIKNAYIGKTPFKGSFNYNIDKKKVLYYDTETQSWKKPILREWDSIEKHNDGKYYYHKRSILKTVNGSPSENWVIRNNKQYAILFGLSVSNARGGILSICDKLNSYSSDHLWNTNLDEGVYVIDYIHINMLKIKVNSVEALKTWLQSNPLTIVYKAETEKVYECTPLDLITYEGNTSYMIDSGVITPTTKLICYNNIRDVVKTLKDKVSNLEDKLYQTNLANFTIALNALDTKLKLEKITKASE